MRLRTKTALHIFFNNMFGHIFFNNMFGKNNFLEIKLYFQIDMKLIFKYHSNYKYI